MSRTNDHPLPHVDIYTDGACSGNPGPGGWAAVLVFGEHEKELSGGEDNTTNNRMELTAVIRGLEQLKKKCSVTVYSDSRYVVDAMTKGWAIRWKNNGWKRTKNDPALNPDLWQRLLELCQCQESVEFRWLKGHDKNDRNNRCDALAVSESRKFGD